MQHILSIIAAAGALMTPQTGIATSAPITVSSCTVSDIYNAATTADLGLPFPDEVLELSFRNTDATVATQVTFDVTVDGTHSTVVDRGRFSQGITIDHTFGGFPALGDGSASCSIDQIVFADGRRWTAPGRTTAANG
jgi:hypothetical protein